MYNGARLSYIVSEFSKAIGLESSILWVFVDIPYQPGPLSAWMPWLPQVP